ncbi:hypothetical protein [Streptomyces werraensis]|uniref:hypothetical protein n=1 Tax=Streptomyces werraensis TaxID=68284 RepID=UPI00380C3BFC
MERFEGGEKNRETAATRRVSEREDQPAVVQGITTRYNSGVNEVRICDPRLQKRIMAGRAGVPLLRHRVILMALLRRRHS